MSEYCEYMWSPSMGHASLALARSLYEDGARLDPTDKKLAVKTVRAILRDMPDVDLKLCTDEYITRFLLARKYRTEQAAALIAAYQAQLINRQDIFGNLTARDPALQRALRAGIPGVLPARDRKGRCVLVVMASQWDPIAVPALAVQRAIFLVLEILIQDPRNQRAGFVAVVDWSGFTLRQGGALGAGALRNLIAALRGRFPARFKAVHFLSSPLCVQATLALVKPFLDEKTRNKIYLHGNNMSTLHDHLPTDILPAELGGTGPAFNPGLWAEPVIHSAMKEAELAAAALLQREKDRAEQLNDANKPTNPSRTPMNDQTKVSEEAAADNERSEQSFVETDDNKVRFQNKDYKNLENSNLTNTARTESISLVSATENQVEDSEKITNSTEIERSKENLMPFKDEQNNACTDDVDGKTTEAEMKHCQNTNKDGKNEMNANENDDSKTQFQAYKDEEANEYRDDLENIRSQKPPEDTEAFEMHSETNSNEFEMVPSLPESEDSKDSSLDMKVEKVVVRTAKSNASSEEANLIT